MKKKIFKTYFITVTALLAVIALAVFLPQIVFYVQDSYQVSRIDVINRDVYDIMEMQTAYSADTATRLKKLSEVGYGNITVSLVENIIDYDELYSIISVVRNSEYMTNLTEITYNDLNEVMSTIGGDDLEKCNRYIVYGPSYSDGVILMFWYMKIYLPSVDSYMEIIVDSETHTIYYVSLEASQEVTYVVEEDGKLKEYTLAEGETLEIEEGTVAILTEPVEQTLEQMETIQLIAQKVPEQYVSSYRAYYGADAQVVSSYDEEVRLVAENSVLDGNTYTFAAPLEYDGPAGSVFFLFYAETSSGPMPNFTVGIPIIRRLIN